MSSTPGAIFSPGGSTHRVLVIDSSYSMAYKPGDRSRFDQAKQWAARLSNTACRATASRWCKWPTRRGPSFRRRHSRPNRSARKSRTWNCCTRGPTCRQRSTEVRKLLDAARRDSPRLAHAEVYIFTDMQRAKLDAGNERTREAELRSRSAELASVARCT